MEIKEYIKPQIEIMIVEAEGVMAASVEVINGTVEDNIIIRSRKQSFWED